MVIIYCLILLCILLFLWCKFESFVEVLSCKFFKKTIIGTVLQKKENELFEFVSLLIIDETNKSIWLHARNCISAPEIKEKAKKIDLCEKYVFTYFFNLYHSPFIASISKNKEN